MSSVTEGQQAPPPPLTSKETSASVAMKSAPSQGPPPPPPGKEKNDVSPEILKMQKLFEKFTGRDDSRSNWEKTKRKFLRSLSFHAFVGATASGIILYILVSIWFMLLTHAKVVYTFPTNFTTSDAQTIDVKSPFLSEVKYGLETFSYYSNGCILMIIGGVCCFHSLTAPYHSRAIRFFGVSLLLLLTTFTLIVGPVLSLTTVNTELEAKLLDQDSNFAYEQSIKGSITYFQHRQCDIIGRAVKGHEKKEADEMRGFCNLLSRLVYIYHFMAATAIIPLFGAIVCWLQIAINRKVWNVKTIRRAKARTKEQKQADRCLHD